MPESKPIIPVILSGGSGTRLWPMSRPERPKQLLALTSELTMLQLAIAASVGLGLVVGIALATLVVNQEATRNRRRS